MDYLETLKGQQADASSQVVTYDIAKRVSDMDYETRRSLVDKISGMDCETRRYVVKKIVKINANTNSPVLDELAQDCCEHYMVRDHMVFQIDKTPKVCIYCGYHN